MELDGHKETLIPGYSIQLCTDQELVGVRHRIKVEAKRLAEKALAEEEEAFTKEEEEELGRMFADGWMRRKKPEVMQARKPAPKPVLPPIEGCGFFSNQVVRLMNLLLKLQVLTGKVWRATTRLHWAFRLVITAPVALLSFGFCPLAPVMLLLGSGALVDLAFENPKAWLGLTAGLIVGAFFIWLLWSFFAALARWASCSLLRFSPPYPLSSKSDSCPSLISIACCPSTLVSCPINKGLKAPLMLTIKQIPNHCHSLGRAKTL